MSRALLLIGSPKPKSTSRVLGEVVLARLAAQGWDTQALRLTGLLDAQEGRARLSGEFLEARLVILAAPVYVDAPPAPVLRAFEFLAGEPAPRETGRRRFAAVFNCGFPETVHTAISLDICRLFAREAGLEWAGGLGVGGGGAVGDGPLEARGRITANLRRALDLAGEALARGEPVPPEALDLAARPLAPRWLYLLMAEAGWLARAWKRGTLFKLGDAPFRKP